MTSHDDKIQADARASIAGVRQRAEGNYEFHARDRNDLLATLGAAAAAGADTTIMVNGLTATTLAVYAETICDLAVETDVPLVFHHRDRLLQLSVARDPRLSPAQ